MRYEFGKNWREYVEKNYSDDRVKIAQDHLLGFLHLPDLKGKTFLDIGSGSGIHSLAAVRSGAERVVSFDYDVDSVKTTEFIREREGEPANWKVLQGSVLDVDFMKKLEPADIVYSWGVLHHTGEMWPAVANAAIPMKDNSVFYIALYSSDVYLDPPPEYWLKIKQRYNQAGRFRRKLMEIRYAMRDVIVPSLKRFRNPFKVMREYHRSRGMSYWTDVKDWLGGWPMDFASAEETKQFCGEKLGLELIHMLGGEGNTEYLFRKKGASTYWDQVEASRDYVDLQEPYKRGEGHMFVASLPALSDQCDTVDAGRRSRLELFEDDVPMGFGHQQHHMIQTFGKGRYSHWGDELLFASTDNTDPNTNGRRYRYCVKPEAS